MYGFFNRAHADFWCDNPQRVDDLRGSEGDIDQGPTLANIEATLAAAGMDFSNVVDAMVYISDIRYYQDMNEVYAEIVPSPKPSRATVGAELMSPDALVEIMMVAVK